MTIEQVKGSWNFLVDSSGSLETETEYWNEGCEVEKILLWSRESNEEEIILEGEDRIFLALEVEVSFLFLSQDVIEAIGEWWDDSMASRKDLDPMFLLKTELILISFFMEVNFFEQSIFFVANISPI